MNQKSISIFIILFIFILFSTCVFAADENTTTESYRVKPIQDKLAALTNEDIDRSVSKFTDIKKHWAASYIGKLSTLGIVSGNGNGTFKPDSPVQADQFIKMTVRALGYTLVEDKSDWSKVYIDIAKSNGLLLDKEIADFKKPITREQMARIIVRASNTFNVCPDSKFDNYLIGKLKDYQKISDACKQFVIKAYELGLVTGSNDSFNPKASLTRAEASTVIIRLIDKKELKPMAPMPDEIIQFQDGDGNWKEVYPGAVQEYFDIAKAMMDLIPKAKGYVRFGVRDDCTGGVNFYKDVATYKNNPFDAIGMFNIDIDDLKYPDSTVYNITVYDDVLYKQLFADYSHAVLKTIFGKDLEKAIVLHDKYMNMINNTGKRIWEDTRLNNRKVGAFRDTVGFVFNASVIGKK